jgi:UDP-N-acetylmuramate dehydrogenase
LKVLVNSPMSLHTTWRIGGPADLLVRVATTEDLIAVARWSADAGMPATVIGGGSNLLVGERGVRGVVILARTPGERAEGLVESVDAGDEVRLTAGAQAPLSWVGRFASERGWGGLDWVVGLPGTIGGAVVNNAGAHGAEMKDRIEQITVLSAGEISQRDRSWLSPSYRMTAIKAMSRPRPVQVLSVTLRLPKANPAKLVALADEHAAYRKSTQPTGRCAGSTFTNPPGDYAGRLIEAAGLKGFTVGPVSVSTKHSNFIVNSGDGTAAHVRELIATVRDRVLANAGVLLEPEIEELGEFD